MSAASSGVKNAPGMLCTIARRNSPAARGIASSAATRPAAGGLAEHRDLVRVAAERADVVPYPFQRGDLVEQAAVRRRAVDLGETLDARPGS